MSAIAVLGAGKIGEALVAGLVSSRWAEPGEIVATRRNEALAASALAGVRASALTEHAGATRRSG